VTDLALASAESQRMAIVCPSRMRVLTFVSQRESRRLDLTPKSAVLFGDYCLDDDFLLLLISGVHVGLH